MSFDDQIRAALDSTAVGLREQVEAQLRAFSQQAIRAAVEERQQAVQAAADAARAEVRAHAEALVGEIRAQAEAQVAQIRAAAQKHADEVKRAAEAQIAELRKSLDEVRSHAQQQLDAARRTAQTDIEQAQAERDRARADIEAANAEIEKARAEMGAARSEAEQAHANAETARAQADAARAEAQAARAEAHAARADADSAHVDAQAARQDVTAARAEAQAACADAEAARAETQRVRAEMEVARAAVHADVEEKVAAAVARARNDVRRSALSRAAWLMDALRSIDESRGISTVLDRLVQCAGQEAERAAMLVVKGERLTGWRCEGFASDVAPAKSIDMSVEEAGLAGVVLQTGISTSRTVDEAHGPALPPFAGDLTDRRQAVAIPVLVGGEVVAVLYADGPCVDSDTADTWPKTLDVLVRYGSRVLEAITVMQAAGFPLPESLARGSHMPVSTAVEHA